MKLKSKVVIVMPAFNAATTLAKTVKDVPRGFADEIILVDDSNQDETVAIAQKLCSKSGTFPWRYMNEASSIGLRRSIGYGLGTIQTVFQFILQKLHLMKFKLFES